MIGAILLTAVSEFVNLTPEVKLIFYGVALLLIVMVVPEGIVPGTVRLVVRVVTRRWRTGAVVPVTQHGAAARPAPALVPGDSSRGPQPPEPTAVDR